MEKWKLFIIGFVILFFVGFLIYDSPEIGVKVTSGIIIGVFGGLGFSAGYKRTTDKK